MRHWLHERMSKQVSRIVLLIGLTTFAVWFVLGSIRGVKSERVTQGPDLVPSNFILIPTTLPDGSSITSNFTVSNQGNNSAPETTTRIVISSRMA